ncbi:hypothetical protein CLV63_12770 [Murinocardiopsis flavida]|uniref:Uncharacterized protein n=1 Tax=Murinocardiopsis flavida TaxID=645275 RepID=A0A2P8CW63_9ACTN|nr:hypothetical protein [Murinocardiopsis flavida]PSK89197.1 hypothetical protein CLV63_12770 [Murinocardiopsis flavida]
MNAHPSPDDLAPAARTPPPQDAPADDALGDFLTEQDSPWLAEQLLRVAGEDPVAHARLAAAAGLDSAVPLAEQALRDAVTGLRPGTLDWDIDGDDGSGQLLRCVELLDDLAGYGYETESAQLARHAADLLDDTHPGHDDPTTLALIQRATPPPP